MSEMPVTVSRGRAHFTDGALVYAGQWVHEAPMEDHTHNFVEIAVVTGGGGVHRSRAGGRRLSVGWPDQSYFARRFKAHFGLSATSYRRRFADGTRRLQP